MNQACSGIFTRKPTFSGSSACADMWKANGAARAAAAIADSVKRRSLRFISCLLRLLKLHAFLADCSRSIQTHADPGARVRRGATSRPASSVPSAGDVSGLHSRVEIHGIRALFTRSVARSLSSAERHVIVDA